MNPLSIAALEQTARRAAQHAYAPYSKFPVGAAVIAGDGTQYAGCNVENASFGLTNCAERTAVFNAVARGNREIKCIAVYTPTATPTAPCGACRQVLREFGPDMIVISICDGPERMETGLDQLLPQSFGPESLPSDGPV